MRKSIFILLCLVMILSGCRYGEVDGHSTNDSTIQAEKENDSVEKESEPIKPASVTVHEDLYPFSWKEKERKYDGDFSYLDTAFFQESDIITLRSACKYKEGKSPVAAGGWVYCEELEDDLSYYDLKEMAEEFRDQSMHICTDNGYITKEMTEYNDSMFFKLLDSAEEYTPIPAVYDVLSPLPVEGLVWMVKEGSTDVSYRLSVYDMGDGYYLLKVVYDEKDMYYVRPQDGSGPAVKKDYYYSAAIIK